MSPPPDDDGGDATSSATALSTALLFGNVDESGQLDESEDWSRELRAATALDFLSTVTGGIGAAVGVTTSGASSTQSVASTSVSASGASVPTSTRTTSAPTTAAQLKAKLHADGSIAHAADAQDYADIDEMVDGDDEHAGDGTAAASTSLFQSASATRIPSSSALSKPLRPLQLKSQRVQFRVEGATAVDEDDEAEVADDDGPAAPDVYALFPGFRPDKVLKFSELFHRTKGSTRASRAAAPSSSMTPAQRATRKQRMEALARLLRQRSLPAFDQRHLFESDVPLLETAVSSSNAADDLYALMKGRSSVEEFGGEGMGDGTGLGGKLLCGRDSRESLASAGTGNEVVMDLDASELHPLNTTDWESRIVWEEGDRGVADAATAQQAPATPTRMDLQMLNKLGPYAVPNFDLEVGDWMDAVVWDDQDIPKLKHMCGEGVLINLNDPHMFVELTTDVRSAYHQRMMNQKRKRGRPPGAATAGNAAPGQNTGTALARTGTGGAPPSTGFMSRWPGERFNLSNDLYYDFYRRSGRVRQMFGRSHVQHSLPALRLQLPFFKRFMTKSDLRSLHRPPLRFAAGASVKFTRVRNLKKKKVKGKDVSEIITDPKHVTLKDNSNYLLFEFSEEYPPLLSNAGMGSALVNYYRKKDDRDPFVPRLPDGLPSILEHVDASPFFIFGNVFPGQTLQAIKNNLFIAPIFKHDAHPEDFLFVRVTHRGQQKFYVREIPRVYTVGQTLPLQEVQPPQSRKIKNYVKDRLKFGALRYIKRHGRNARYRLSKMVNSYADYHLMSLKKHLKDFAEFEKYKNDFMLKIHPTVPIPTEQELYKIVSPEQVCLFESMRAGQQRLIDSGFGATGGMDSDDDDDDEMRVDAEVALAPWNITKNVLLACHNKGMCRVYGPGDPTGRGEGFSFFRFSMKKMFLRSGASQEEIAAAKEARTKTGHKFAISEQQKVYKEEILRIWLAQLQSLSNEEEPGLSDDDYQEMEHDEEAEQYAQEQEDEEDYDMAEGSPAGTLTIIDHGVGGAAAKTLSHAIDVSSADGGSRASSPALFPSRLLHQRPDMGDDQMTAETQSVSSSRYAGRSRGGLLISRTVRNEDGEEEQREEVITDPRVINAYRKQKRLLQLSDAFNAEDDEETRKRKLIEELRRRKRMQGKRSKEERAAASTTKRKCKACGATGHIASNKVCPKYYQTFPERLKKEKEKAASAKAAAAAAAAASTPAPVKAQNGKITISSSAIASSKKSLTVKLPSIKLISGTASGTSSKHASPEK